MGGIKITMADKWFSLSIREAYDWTCCRCGTQYHHNHQGLDCSHGYSQRQLGHQILDPQRTTSLYGLPPY